VIDDLHEQSVGSTILEQRGIRSLAGVPLLVQGPRDGRPARRCPGGRALRRGGRPAAAAGRGPGRPGHRARPPLRGRAGRPAGRRTGRRADAALQALTAGPGGLPVLRRRGDGRDRARPGRPRRGRRQHRRPGRGAEELRALATVGVSKALATGLAPAPAVEPRPVADAVRAAGPVLLGSSAELRRAYPDAIMPGRTRSGRWRSCRS
jgi:hypothetical protein